MNGFMNKKWLAGLCLTGVVSLSGHFSLPGWCDGGNGHCYDPCWPERYNYMARETVLEVLGAQCYNGHVLDQTVWNYYFELGTDPKTGKLIPTDRLNPLGLQRLTYMARRRPNPDPKVYLQTAQEICYDPADPEKFTRDRAELDGRRLQAVHKYLQAVTAARNLGYDFVIQVHDPAEVGIAATPIGGNLPPVPVFGSVPQLYGNFRGVLPINTGGSTGNSFGTPGGGGSYGGTSSGTGVPGSMGAPGVPSAPPGTF
jgi:hypothetical protein